MNKKITTKLLGMIILIGCIVGIPMFFLAHSKPVQYVEAAGSSLDVLGYAWSWHPHEQDAAQISQTPTVFSSSQTGTQGFGWISMSGTNQNSGGGSYQVTLDPTTGKFSGYAWSENGGWVNFAPTGQYPSVAGTTPQSAFVDPACLAVKTRTCPVKGWIRFVEGTSGNSSWDGWVNMEIFNTATAASVYFGATATGKGVQLLPESNSYRPMDGYAWGDDLVGVIGFSKAKIKIEPIDQVDMCPDTKINGTGNPKNGTIDPKTAGTQTTLPADYSVQTINGVAMCGIFGCTDKTATNFVKSATVDDGSCLPPVDVCPDTMFDLITDHPGQGYANGTYIPKTVGMQTVLPSTNVGSYSTFQVRDGRCGIFGCTDTSSPNYLKGAQIDDGSCISSTPMCSDGITPAPGGDVNQCPKTCPDGSAVPPEGCSGGTNACTTASPTYNPIFKDCRECHPGVTGYNTTTGLCEVTPPVECDSTSPDYNPITKDCRTCHPGVAGYNDKTGRCTIPGGHKTPIYIET